MDKHSDAESEGSLPEILTKDDTNQFDIDDLINYRNDTERHSKPTFLWEEQANQRTNRSSTGLNREDILQQYGRERFKHCLLRTRDMFRHLERS